jgi:hypothetical protein
MGSCGMKVGSVFKHVNNMSFSFDVGWIKRC